MIKIKNKQGDVLLEYPGDSLIGADLRGVDLNGADLRGANLEKADLTEANMMNADLSGAILQWTRSYKTNFDGANFQKARLYPAFFSHCTLKGANFDKSLMVLVGFGNCDLTGAIITPNRPPAHPRCTALGFEDSNLSGAIVWGELNEYKPCFYIAGNPPLNIDEISLKALISLGKLTVKEEPL